MTFQKEVYEELVQEGLIPAPHNNQLHSESYE